MISDKERGKKINFAPEANERPEKSFLAAQVEILKTVSSFVLLSLYK